MSTRANIILMDAVGGELIFYKHSDGYPEGTLPILRRFLDKVKNREIRDNISQSGGWLIVFGREEYIKETCSHSGFNDVFNWKVGQIEPTTGIHGDIEWLYIVDLAKKEIRYSQMEYDEKYHLHVPQGFYDGVFNQ